MWPNIDRLLKTSPGRENDNILKTDHFTDHTVFWNFSLLLFNSASPRVQTDIFLRETCFSVARNSHVSECTKNHCCDIFSAYENIFFLKFRQLILSKVLTSEIVTTYFKRCRARQNGRFSKCYHFLYRD